MKIHYITNRKTKRIAIYHLDELNPDVVTIYCIRPVGAFLRRETITLE